MTRIVVGFTADKRGAYLAPVLDSWSKVRGISGTQLLFAKEPGSAECARLCTGVRFAPRKVLWNMKRRGVLENPHYVLHTAFTGYGADFAVLAEDDLVVSPDILEFFTWCQRYRDDPSVLGVTTYQHHEQPGGLAGAGPADWSRDDEFHFWVWGTWADRWQKYLEDDWDTDYSRKGWDWDIRDRLVAGEGMTMIAPSMARSQHIGKYGGAHCTPAQFAGLRSRCFAGLDVPPQEYEEITRDRVA